MERIAVGICHCAVYAVLRHNIYIIITYLAFYNSD